jgi:radical SAM protein with 4Fe4S-binding SPASM domain
MVVNKLNVADVRLTAKNMAALGVKRFAATPVSLNAKSPQPELILTLKELCQVLDDLIWAYEELGLEVDVMEALPKCAIPDRAFELKLPFVNRACFAGRRNGTISPLGDVRPCGHNPNSFGNILINPIDEIWDRLQDWRGIVDNQHRNCLACDIQSSCDGGCMFSGHPHNPSVMTMQKYLEISHLPGRSTEPISLTAETIVRPYRQILSRREGNNWLICSNSSRNLLTVNEVLYEFIKKTRGFPPMKLEDLAAQFGTNYTDPDFQSIITTLIAKSFFIRVGR